MRYVYILCLLFWAVDSSASLGLEWQYYTSPPSSNIQARDYFFLEGEREFRFQRRSFSFHSHIQARYALGKSDFFYWNIPELSLHYRYDLKQFSHYVKFVEVYLGRKIKNWSEADGYWNMGLWNPLSRWNPLHPTSSGLSGSFLTLGSQNWSFDVFLGALYVPNQETKSVQEEGRIYSHSRWFSPLPDQVDVLNINIRYLSHTPFIFDVLLQGSYVMSFKTWSETKNPHYWMKWSIADKPANHLFFVLNSTNLFRIGKEKDAEGSIYQGVTILPVRQRLLAAEWGLSYYDFSAVFNLENSRNKEIKESPRGWAFLNSRENFTYFSTILKYNWEPKSFVRLAYIQSWFHNYNINRSEISEKNPPPTGLFRYKVLGGLGLDIEKDFSSLNSLKRVLTLQYRYSFLNEGSWLFLRFLYGINSQFHTEWTVNILGAKDNQTYFFNRFRHNDYFSWSVVYDF